MMSVSCSNTLTFAPECWKYILRSPDFNFFPETRALQLRVPSAPQPTYSYFPTYLKSY